MRTSAGGPRRCQQPERSASGLSIVVADANVGARRLYERCGYAEVAMRAMVKEACNNTGENWVLLVKRLP